MLPSAATCKRSASSTHDPIGDHTTFATRMTQTFATTRPRLVGLDYRAAHQCHGKIAGPRIFGPAELVRQPFGARCDYLRKSVRALASIRFVGNKFASAWAICPIRLLRQPR